MIASEATQRRVASIALAATMPSGFALAGSSAIREHGFTRRPTADIDLFTIQRDPRRFGATVDELVAQLDSAGFAATVTRRFELFARLRVQVGNESVDIDLGTDWRAHEPVVLAIGAVLDPVDAVANKVGALFSRAEARDYLDVDAIRQSGRLSDAELLASARDHDPGFDQRVFARQLRAVDRIGSRRVAEYDVTAAGLAAIKQRLHAWADEIDAAHE